MSKGRKAGSVNGLELMVMYIFLLFFLVVADQMVKKVIDFSMAYGENIPVIEKFFSLHYVRNTGSAFSLFADKSWGITVLTIISAVLGGIVVIFMGIACAKRLKLLGMAFCLIASGAFGKTAFHVLHLDTVFAHLFPLYIKFVTHLAFLGNMAIVLYSEFLIYCI